MDLLEHKDTTHMSVKRGVSKNVVHIQYTNAHDPFH